MRSAAPAPAPVAPQVTPRPVASYADQLSALEARRRATDDIPLRKMVNSRDTTRFGMPTSGSVSTAANWV